MVGWLILHETSIKLAFHKGQQTSILVDSHNLFTLAQGGSVRGTGQVNPTPI